MNLMNSGISEPQLQVYEFDEFRVDASKRTLTKGDGEQIPLKPKVFDTLLYLVRHGGKVIGKDELMSEIWMDSIVEENNLNQNISMLRRIFGEKPGQQRFIVTVAGHGYRFVPEVRLVLDQPISKDQTTKTPDLSEKAPDQNRRSKLHKVKWLAVLAASSVLVLAAVGYRLLKRTNERSVDAPIRTIAVLPFKPLVVENRNEALEFGMADTLISKLSGSDEVVVRPLSASRRFTSLDQDSLMAGRDLGVESILDGTIRTWGDRIRISVKLVRTSDGKQLWAEQFDEKFTDIFVVQDSISEKVAAALKVRLGGRGKRHADGEYRSLPALYERSIPFVQIDAGARCSPPLHITNKRLQSTRLTRSPMPNSPAHFECMRSRAKAGARSFSTRERGGTKGSPT